MIFLQYLSEVQTENFTWQSWKWQIEFVRVLAEILLFNQQLHVWRLLILWFHEGKHDKNNCDGYQNCQERQEQEGLSSNVANKSCKRNIKQFMLSWFYFYSNFWLVSLVKISTSGDTWEPSWKYFCYGTSFIFHFPL